MCSKYTCGGIDRTVLGNARTENKCVFGMKTVNEPLRRSLARSLNHSFARHVRSGMFWMTNSVYFGCVRTVGYVCRLCVCVFYLHLIFTLDARTLYNASLIIAVAAFVRPSLKFQLVSALCSILIHSLALIFKPTHKCTVMLSFGLCLKCHEIRGKPFVVCNPFFTDYTVLHCGIALHSIWFQ